ncbi:peptidylprolyl isomerase [Sphingomonas spermidinifaciens]|uniref:Parvulin-like PPIase n=1 Tax=Sphingomonas spermidinifaciens TaxID=1141889 RepID=A0A2A4B524_9SPHN|nr:peptidylprolyl isomerase [Sphingomonas spermidinifaciens]PCD03180.1 peptidylprolyl isomerase [Sphingomonas spermidinifaciens]
MLNFFRRMVKSKFGVLFTLAALAIIAISFGLADINGLSQPGGARGATLIEVAGEGVGENDLRQRTRLALDAVRQQQEGLDMPGFLNAGGFESVVARVENGLALERFAEESGMVASKALVDGQIASIPAFQGFDGKFSQTNFERALAQRQITPEQLRTDIARETYAQWLLTPTIGASQVGDQLALPYANLLLERRKGQIALVPTRVDASANPTDQQLSTFYGNNRQRYTVPERRVVRYAVVTPAAYAARVQVTDADLQAAYKAAGDKYAPSATRTLEQVVVLDQALASKIAGQVKGGTAVAAAARAAGLEATTATDIRQSAFATQTSADVAKAAFAAPQGGVVGPVRSPLGFHIIKVTGISQSAGRPLAAVRDELTAEVRKRKEAEALADAQQELDTGIADGATFDELIADQKLQAQTTPALTAQGINPDAPGQAPDPRLATIMQAGFAAQDGDAPQIVPVGQDGTFAIVALGRIVPAAARPLQSIRAAVVEDWRRQQAKLAARRIADAVVANVGRGTALRQALGAAGVTGAPAVQTVDVSRAELAARQIQLPPPVELMFKLKQGTAKLLEAPNNGGWFVVTVTGITPGDARKAPGAVQSTRAGLGSVVGREYAEQFTNAAKKQLGATRNAAGLAKLKADLAGQGAVAE